MHPIRTPYASKLRPICTCMRTGMLIVKVVPVVVGVVMLVTMVVVSVTVIITVRMRLTAITMLMQVMTACVNHVRRT